MSTQTHGVPSWWQGDESNAEQITSLNNVYWEVLGRELDDSGWGTYNDWDIEDMYGELRGSDEYYTRKLSGQLPTSEWDPHATENFDFSQWGGEGFGLEDLKYGLTQGYDTQKLYDLRTAAQEKNLNIGRGVSDFLDWDFSAYGGEGFGVKDIEAAEAKPGYTPAVVRALRSMAEGRGLNIGAAAQEYNTMLPFDETKTLDVDADYGAETQQSPQGFQYGDWGEEGFGLIDTRRMLQQGKSFAEIRAQSKDAMSKGLNVGRNVNPYLDWNFNTYGGSGLGLKDFDQLHPDVQKSKLLLTGLSDTARSRGLNVGIGFREKLASMDWDYPERNAGAASEGSGEGSAGEEDVAGTGGPTFLRYMGAAVPGQMASGVSPKRSARSEMGIGAKRSTQLGRKYQTTGINL